MAKGKKTSEAKKQRRKNYANENRHAKNKLKRLRKYVLKNPKDLQAQAALKRLEGEVKYTRNHPTTGKGINNNERILRPLEARINRGVRNRAEYGRNWQEPRILPEYQKMLGELLKEMMDRRIRVRGKRV